MSWKELINDVNEMRQMTAKDIMNNPMEISRLINGWNSLILNSSEFNLRYRTVYYILRSARKISLQDKTNIIPEILKPQKRV